MPQLKMLNSDHEFDLIEQQVSVLFSLNNLAKVIIVDRNTQTMSSYHLIFGIHVKFDMCISI